jgi:hypothetical protein
VKKPAFVSSEPRLIVEKRDADGNLDLSDPQPPTELLSTTIDDLCQLYFRESGVETFTWEAFREWLGSRGWVYRPRTWLGRREQASPRALKNSG